MEITAIQAERARGRRDVAAVLTQAALDDLASKLIQGGLESYIVCDRIDRRSRCFGSVSSHLRPEIPSRQLDDPLTRLASAQGLYDCAR